MNAPAELKIDRSRFIGGSDAAAILGVSPWATRLDVFLEKIGQGKPQDPKKEKLFRRGKREEPRVIDDLVEDYGIKVTKRSTPEAPNRYVDPEHDFLAAEIDFEWEVTLEVANYFDLPEELVGTIQNGEVKTVHIFAADKFGEAETDEVPVEYAAQAMHGLMVTNRQLTMFAVKNGFETSVYWIRRDDETIAGMRAQEVDFWHDHALTRKAPAPMRLPDIYELFGRVPAIHVEVPVEISDAVHELADLRNAERVAKEGQEELKFKIGEYVLGKESIVLGADGRAIAGPNPKTGKHLVKVDGLVLLEIGLQSQSRLDGDKVKKDHPDVAMQCLKTLSFYKFAKPKKPKQPRSKK